MAAGTEHQPSRLSVFFYSRGWFDRAPESGITKFAICLKSSIICLIDVSREQRFREIVSSVMSTKEGLGPDATVVWTAVTIWRQQVADAESRQPSFAGPSQAVFLETMCKMVGGTGVHSFQPDCRNCSRPVWQVRCQIILTRRKRISTWSEVEVFVFRSGCSSETSRSYMFKLTCI